MLVKLARTRATSAPGRWLSAGESSAAALMAGSALAVITNSRTCRIRSRGIRLGDGRGEPGAGEPVAAGRVLAVRRLIGIATGMVSTGTPKCS